MMHDFAKNGKKKRRIVLNDTALYGLEGSRTLDLSDANRTLSQLSYEPIFKPPKTAWGRVVYNSRLFKDRMGSQLSYRPIFVFQNENSVTLLEGFVKDFSLRRPAGNGRADLPRCFL